DEEDNDGKRPEGIIVQLYANGEPLSFGRVILSANNNWSASWQSSTQYPIYLYEKAQLIDYSVEELGYVIDGQEYTGLPDGYSNAYSGNPDNEYQLYITNSHVTEKISLDVQKLWEDDDNNDGKRPDKLSFTLLKNGQPYGDKLILTEATGWKARVDGLYKYTGGVTNVYELLEDVPQGYTADYASSTDANGNLSFTVTNSHTSETKDFTVTKVWLDGDDRAGIRPDYIRVQLYKNGNLWGDYFTLSAADNWQQHFTLPLYEDGQALTWTVRERLVPLGYSVYYQQESLTIINSTTPKTGDSGGLGLWLILMGLSGLGATACTLRLKRKRS
ncbi:MAG: Cna B-type domain-containing protein, partial [Oscillospiraceae bacterium]|nr:Cna B-type domain-containing protein [Oscillospiraceae bacterium]